MKNYPATNVDDAYKACNPEHALQPGDPRYVDLAEARGAERLAETVMLRIRRAEAPDYHCQLVTGHRGSGKSTELLRLQQRLEKEKFFTILLDVTDHLDLGDIRYLDVLLVIARVLESRARELGVAVNPDILRNLEKWFSEKILTETEQKDRATSFGAGASAKGGAPVVDLMADVELQFKSGSSRRVEIRQNMERELGLFLSLLNLLIKDARDKVRAKGYSDIVIIVDSLEKMLHREDSDGKSQHYDLFVNHAEQLKAPACHLVYTVPIWLFYEAGLGNVFSAGSYVIPMVRHWTDEGRDRLREIVARRVSLADVYENPSDVDDFIALSGGSTRDLLRMVRISFDNVTIKVGPKDSQRAMTTLVREYDYLLRDEDMEKLDLVERTGCVPTPVGYAKLLEHRLIHEYKNSHNIYKVHPAVLRCMQHRKKTL